jgi:hypothetical protein
MPDRSPPAQRRGFLAAPRRQSCVALHRPAPAGTGSCGKGYYDPAIGICFGYTWHSARRHAGGSAQPKAPTAEDVVNAIQRGQTASASLSRAGGTAPDTQLTPEVLANMSDADFENLYNELMATGNKEKLMQIFGH